MQLADWITLCVTLGFIILYGIYKSGRQKDLNAYILGERSQPWYSVLFSIMATQASAITFLSAPGQAYTDGMRFVQYYFGLPLAMIVVSAIFLPKFLSQKIFTAYEYLEQRFDLNTRMYTAFLFLVQRGLATGLTIYAPSLVLSAILGWDIHLTTFFMGALVIVYTVSGGSKAVSVTQTQQLIVIFAGMLTAAIIIVKKMPEGIGFTEALALPGAVGKLKTIATEFNPSDKYNIWSGLIGGFFLALSYFGTDQSQVGRYITGKSLKESRMGLLMNGIVKIPMQFLILLIGALLYTFYHFYAPPLNFNPAVEAKLKEHKEWNILEHKQQAVHEKMQPHISGLAAGSTNENHKIVLKQLYTEEQFIRKQADSLAHKIDKTANTDDTNYIFLHFVINYLPAGLIGLLIACIFCASWSSTSAALSALSSTFIVDFYRRGIKPDADEKHYVAASRIATLSWGLFSICVAFAAGKMGSLIEAVNVLGSLFYGPILGIFLCAFFLKKVKGWEVFYAGILAELLVIGIYFFGQIGFLWFNLIGSLAVVVLALALRMIRNFSGSPAH